MPKTENHTHQLRRHTYSNGTKVYFCVLDCNFKVDAAFALGKIVLCNQCKQPFEMTEYTIKLARPHCSECGKMEIEVDGKKIRVNKRRPQAAIAELGKQDVSSMRDRMGKVVTMEKDEDI